MPAKKMTVRTRRGSDRIEVETRPNYTERAIKKASELGIARIQGATSIAEIKAEVDNSMRIVEETHNRLQDKALESHHKVLEAANKREAWLKETSAETGIHAEAKGIGVGFSRKKRRVPIDDEENAGSV